MRCRLPLPWAVFCISASQACTAIPRSFGMRLLQRLAHGVAVLRMDQSKQASSGCRRHRPGMASERFPTPHIRQAIGAHIPRPGPHPGGFERQPELRFALLYLLAVCFQAA